MIELLCVALLGIFVHHYNVVLSVYLITLTHGRKIANGETNAPSVRPCGQQITFTVNDCYADETEQQSKMLHFL